MKSYHHKDHSLQEVHETIDTTAPHKGWRNALAFLGPAYLISVGYMDPGNWATDLQGGAQFGYTLIWILLMSNLIALFLQYLSAKLGIVRRRDLAQANREVYPPLINFCLYILAEIAIAACDLAEVLGMAIGIQLLTGLPLIWGVGITVLDTLLLLWLQKFGIRKLEAFIIGLVAIIGLSFLIEIILAKPNLHEVVQGFVPSSLNDGALYIAVGMIGATVMPHNLYLHSALVQTRKIGTDAKSIGKAIRLNFIDSSIALNLAFFVNAAILILAATVFFKSGNTNIARIQDAYKLLEKLLGSKLSPILFAIALIAAGQSSTITGTLAGQIVMEGYLKLRINPILRRLLTRLLAIIPAMLTILLVGESKIDDLLILSQVVLSVQLGFAMIPLIHFVSDKQTMGQFAIKPFIQIIAWCVAGLLIYLNVKMVIEQSLFVFNSHGMIGWKFTITAFSMIFVWLFITTLLFPVIQRRVQRTPARIHPNPESLHNLSVKTSHRIAIALDFSDNDKKLIAHAVSQGKNDGTYILVHVVESVSAKYLGEESDDEETRMDRERLQLYVNQLHKMGYKTEALIGYQNRVKEIVRMVEESEADMLVMGAHRHTGLKDYLFGETIEAVRHEINIPVLIVNTDKKSIS